MGMMGLFMMSMIVFLSKELPPYKVQDYDYYYNDYYGVDGCSVASAYLKVKGDVL
jgi:hypothetical protein